MKANFTIQFVKELGPLLMEFGPLLGTLILLISLVAVAIGRAEKWSFTDSLYFGFITATTVGYGDFRPTRNGAKWLAIAIALLGLVLTGIVVALAVEAAGQTYDSLAKLDGGTGL